MKCFWRMVCAVILCNTLTGCALFGSSDSGRDEVTAARSSGVPTAVVPETNYKVKPVPEQSIAQDTGEVFRISHDFKIRNTGTGDLIIKGIKPG